MTVRQIIQEIEALPSEQREEILGFLVNKEATKSADASTVKYVDRAEARRLADQIFTEHAELFKKLAM